MGHCVNKILHGSCSHATLNDLLIVFMVFHAAVYSLSKKEWRSGSSSQVLLRCSEIPRLLLSCLCCLCFDSILSGQGFKGISLGKKGKGKMELLYGSFMLFTTLIGNEQHLLIYANQGRISKLMILMLYILADRAQYFWSRIETLHAWTSVHSGVSSPVLLIWVLAYIW